MAVTYPGIFAVPGSMQPGSIWPGEPLTGASLSGIFVGYVTSTYSQYINLSTGHTLVATPGMILPLSSIEVVNGTVPIPPDDGAWEIHGS